MSFTHTLAILCFTMVDASIEMFCTLPFVKFKVLSLQIIDFFLFPVMPGLAYFLNGEFLLVVSSTI